MTPIIYKYPINITGHQLIAMPKKAKLLHVALDPKGQPCIWALVDLDQPEVWRDIFLYATGQGMTHYDDKQYVGTFQDGSFMWHIFG